MQSLRFWRILSGSTKDTDRSAFPLRSALYFLSFLLFLLSFFLSLYSLGHATIVFWYMYIRVDFTRIKSRESTVDTPWDHEKEDSPLEAISRYLLAIATHTSLDTSFATKRPLSRVLNPV